MHRSVIPYDGFGRWVSLDFVHFNDSSVAGSKPMRCTIVTQNRKTAPEDPVGVTDRRNFSDSYDVERRDFLINTELWLDDALGARCGIGDHAVAHRKNKSQATDRSHLYDATESNRHQSPRMS